MIVERLVDGTYEAMFEGVSVGTAIPQVEGFGSRLSIGDSQQSARGHFDLDYLRPAPSGLGPNPRRDRACRTLPAPEADDTHFFDGIGTTDMVGVVPGVATAFEDVPTVVDGRPTPLCHHLAGPDGLVAASGSVGPRSGRFCALSSRFGVGEAHTFEVAFSFRDPSSSARDQLSWIEPGNTYAVALSPRTLQARTYANRRRTDD